MWGGGGGGGEVVLQTQENKQICFVSIDRVF